MAEQRTIPRRTHYCGELRREHIGQRVAVMGWVHSARDHGGVIFIDLRDRTGIVQVVANPQTSAEAHAVADTVRSEWVVAAVGEVRARSEETLNPKIPTGEIEVFAEEIKVLNKAKPPPFPVEDDIDTQEEVRLRYRYIDLRRPKMTRMLRERARFVRETRAYLDAHGFWEIETPLLIASSPEGARDFLVPSRLMHGHFYALPQSPQLLKQTLMVAGVDRYYQIARCLRDEDTRADRQPEHTQIDIEMSFVERDDVLELVEGLMAHLFEVMIGVEVPRPMPRLTYDEAMERYGSDRPDLRFGMELVDLTDIAANCQFRVFTQAVEAGGIVKGMAVPGGAELSRKELDDLQGVAQKFGAKGAAYIVVERDGTLRSPLVKFFTEEQLREMQQRLGAKPGDLMVFGADERQIVLESMGRLRLWFGQRMNLIDPNDWKFVWIVDFPLFEWDDDVGHYVPMHHPFSMPKAEYLDCLEDDPGAVRGDLYDFVANGIEMGGGSIRIHRRDIQERVFRIIHIDEQEAREKFGYLLDAFEYGAPPHGGIAMGVDRIVAAMLGFNTIRDVIAFPKTQSAQCLLTGAPSRVRPEQLEELGIRIVE